mgnify:CR=1 FL=1
MIDYLLAKNVLPDGLVRFGIRNLLKQRINEDIGNSEEEKTLQTFSSFQPVDAGALQSRRQVHTSVITPVDTRH